MQSDKDAKVNIHYKLSSIETYTYYKFYMINLIISKIIRFTYYKVESLFLRFIRRTKV